MKLCKDCKHVRNTVRRDASGDTIAVASAWWECAAAAHINPVDGSTRTGDCGFTRAFGGHCGPDALLFEPSATAVSGS